MSKALRPGDTTRFGLVVMVSKTCLDCTHHLVSVGGDIPEGIYCDYEFDPNPLPVSDDGDVKIPPWCPLPPWEEEK